MQTKTSNIIEAMEWRYATKSYDTSKTIEDEKLDILLESVRLAPSSYGLQPYKIFVIKNSELRNHLKPAAYNQSQITEASALIVFAAKTNISSEYVSDYISNIATTRGVEKSEVQGFGDYINSTISDFSDDQFTAWNSKQAYIALGVLLQTAAELRVDATPMEGFSAEKFDEILSLKEQGLTTAVIAAIGYRSNEDTMQFADKVRLSKSDLFEII
ncbi:MAG: NAD(P)H-dependent oxidoreductase [Bacteroidetes bacterium]|nr:NAD(P)H-dependent oxidoreductase [Bacteroidota bacterium]